MQKFIRSHISPVRAGRYAFFTIDRYPHQNLCCKKTCLLLAEGLSKRLKIPLIVAQYRYIYKRGKLRQTLPVIHSGKAFLTPLTRILSIDDSIYTGTSLRRTLKTIQVPVRSLDHIAVIRGKVKSAEIPLNNLVFKVKGPVYLPRIINQAGYVFTSQMLKTIDSLSANELRILLRAIGKKSRHRLRSAYMYHNHKPLRLEK